MFKLIIKSMGFNLSIHKLCSCRKMEGQRFIDDYFNSLSITSETEIIDKDKLITLSDENFDDIKNSYIKTYDRRFENTHNDLWNTAPIAVFQNKYRFLKWTIIFLSNVPTKEKITYFNFIENLPETNTTLPKDDVFQFLNYYVNFVSSFAASMLVEKVKGTSPEDLNNCYKFFDKR